MSERRRKLAGIIDDASTVIDERPQLPEPEGAIALGDGAELQRATDSLPAIDVLPQAERILDERGPEWRRDAMEENTAPRVGEYALVARFPSSAASDVFLGYKVSNFGFIRRAVVKWIDRQRIDYERGRQQLLDEARAISFIDHPNIVPILDLAEDEIGMYLALEYVAGTDLRRVLVELGARKELLPVEHAAFVMTEVLRGLHHAHAACGPDGKPLDIVHRDVNPSNVLISESGHVKLTDFGVVLMDGRYQDATAPGAVKGKVRYLAPEYITRQTCTAAVDIYAAGVMLFELLTGRPCFTAIDETSAMFKIVSEGLPVEDLALMAVPEPLQAIVERATKRLPEHRYATALDMCEAIEQFLARAGMFVSPTKLSQYLVSHALLG